MTGVLRAGVDRDATTVGATAIADVRRAAPPLHDVAAPAGTCIEYWCDTRARQTAAGAPSGGPERATEVRESP
ncbi:hypothetical protein [Actinomycetospora sp. CA-053990]|uniref:hypothetical protein n=1 Tax=Actinomycetospora sp. CA-053990 TaxID=3239891 RepID=UPI003D93E7DE